MFQKGDTVIYGCHGVCNIEAVGNLVFNTATQAKSYYTLKPLYRNDTVFYVPVDCVTATIRPTITREEAEGLIAEIPSIQSAWIINEKEREEQYKRALKSCDCRELIKIIKTLFERKKARIEGGKKVTAIDERYFKLAEEQLYGELAFVLKIDKDKMEEHIKECVDK